MSAARRVGGIMGLYFQLQEVWLRSRPKSRTEEALLDLISAAKQDVIDWRELKAKEIVGYYGKLQQRVPEMPVPTIPMVWLMKKNPVKRVYTRAYFQNIWRNWYRHIWNPVKWAEVCTFEVVNAIRFFVDFTRKEKAPQNATWGMKTGVNP